jgi:glycogen(starch) synthase
MPTFVSSGGDKEPSGVFHSNFGGNPRAPLRVLMTADTVGGVWTYAMELIRALPQFEFALATMGSALARAQAQQAGALRNIELFESGYKLEWMNDPWEDVSEACAWLLGLEAKLQPDLVHLNNYPPGALPFRAPKIVVAHSDVLSWWKAVKGEEAPASWERYREVVRGGLRGADVVIAPSQAALKDIVSHYGEPARVKVILNGRDLRFRREAKKPVIFSAGRLWDEAKNISTLAAIAAELTWPVHVAGDLHEPGGKQASFGNVSLVGKLAPEEMHQQFAQAGIYCLPALYEPFGLSILEAALAGCALVLGDIPSLREIWGDAALFVRPTDPEALKEVLQTLIDHPSERLTLSQRAEKRARSFSASRMAQNYADLYTELARKEEALCA